MEWHLVPAAVLVLVGAVVGGAVPGVIRALPEPEPDPSEDPDDFPDKVLYVDLAGRRGLRLGAMAGCAVAAGLLGAALGWSWALPWLLVLVPIGCVLAIVDYVTWYLPTVLIWPTAGMVLALEGVAAVALEEPRVLLAAVLGFIGVGAYYGVLWLISPRIMAFGDVRLGALLGLALGPFGLATVMLSVLTAAVVGAIGLPLLRLLGNSIRRHIPFGPFLIVGALVAVVVGQVLAGL